MSNLTVYKASAGSGKTWRLTVEYLKLLISNPDSYKNILAVTFTNKATGEMKGRILDGMYEIIKTTNETETSGILKTICEELKMTPAKARERATKAMSLIIHDYNRFRVETIDSFFQSILRNLSRELRLGTWMNIELDNKKVLKEAVSKVIEQCTEDNSVLEWISDYIQEQLDEGKNWKIEKTLNDFGKNIFSEKFRQKEHLLKEKLLDKAFLKKFKTELRQIAKKASDEIQKQSEIFFKILTENNLAVEDFNYGKSGIAGYFLKLQKKEFDFVFGSRYTDCYNSTDKWVTAKSVKKDLILNLVSQSLLPLFHEAEDIRTKNLRDYITANIVLKEINNLGLLGDISNQVRIINQENNSFLLSDTNVFLNSIIADSDTSFIYEKTGTEISHVLFDEFQDTSVMQWASFKPLLIESLAGNNRSLIVGDEKQSIYRWRNGDWRILGNISKEIPNSEISIKTLTHNWRSQCNIIDFNNSIFPVIEKSINSLHSEVFEEASTELEKAYADVRQLTNKTEKKGLVEVFIKEKETTNDEIIGELIAKVEELQNQGLKPGDIAIITRKNTEISLIGKAFADYKISETAPKNICFDIVSDEAFLLESSKAVNLIIDVFRLLLDPDDQILQSIIKLDYLQDVKKQKEITQIFKSLQKTKSNNSISDKTAYKKTYKESDTEYNILPEEFTDRFEELQRMPLYEAAEEIYRIFDIKKIDNQDSYLYFFMDSLGEYLAHNHSDLSSFLSYWDEIMSKKKIPSGSEINGIRIMTIHKSKGLEFNTVIIPFCNWKLIDIKDEILWLSSEETPYNKVDILPIGYRKDLKKSLFSGDYKEETLQKWVDAVNMLYVAFTRPRNNLFVWCKKDSKDKINTVGDLVSNALANLHDSDEDTFSIGELFINNEDKTEEKESLNKKGKDLNIEFNSYKQKTKFRQSNKSVEFSKGRDPEGFSSEYIDRGKILHALFSEIKVKEDINNAISKLQYEGLISSEDYDNYLKLANEAINLPEVNDWYSGKYRLFNECSILFATPDGKQQIKRPDRVMLINNDVKVVDFKFGKPSTKYIKQVREYMNLLSDMGYATVEGYIWYIFDRKVEKINSEQLQLF